MSVEFAEPALAAGFGDDAEADRDVLAGRWQAADVPTRFRSKPLPRRIRNRAWPRPFAGNVMKSARVAGSESNEGPSSVR